MLSNPDDVFVGMKAEPKSLKTGRINFLCWSKVRLTHTGAKHQFEITEVIWGQKRPMRSFEAKLTFWTKIGLLPQCVPSGMDHWISSRSNYPVADGTIWPWKGLLLRGHWGLSKVQIGLFLPYTYFLLQDQNVKKKFFFLFQFFPIINFAQFSNLSNSKCCPIINSVPFSIW